MNIVQKLNNGIFDIMLSGKFTFNDHIEFRDILQKMEGKDVQQIILHMEMLEFIDSAALGMLLLAKDAADKYHKHIHISGVTGQVKRVFELARFHTLFSMA